VTVASPLGPSLGTEARYEVRVEDVEYRRRDQPQVQSEDSLNSQMSSQRDGQDVWLARVYRPVGTGPFPALLDVHGGAWSGGTRENNAPIATELASRGLVVVAIDFRLGPQHPYPASIQDTNYGTRWLKRHAVELGIDPRRVGGLGSSSGGHMVLLSALRPHDPRYTSHPLPPSELARNEDASLSYLILLWAVIDPHARYLFAQKAGRADLVARSEGYFRSQEAMQEGNPQLIVAEWVRSGRVNAERHMLPAVPASPSRLPPVLLIQGTADANLPPGMAERFAETYREAGGVIDLHLFPGQTHGFGVRPGADSDRALALIQEFITRQSGPELTEWAKQKREGKWQ